MGSHMALAIAIIGFVVLTSGSPVIPIDQKHPVGTIPPLHANPLHPIDTIPAEDTDGAHCKIVDGLVLDCGLDEENGWD